jgi:hypothetical protein
MIALIPACPVHATDKVGWNCIRSSDQAQCFAALSGQLNLRLSTRHHKSSAVSSREAVNAKPAWPVAVTLWI